MAACSAWAAAALSQPAYGVAAAAIDPDEGPAQAPVVNPEITELYSAAAEFNSAANSRRVAAAASIGPDPGPAYMRAELISGR